MLFCGQTPMMLRTSSGLFCYLEIIQKCRAGCGPEEGGEDPDQGALARPVRTQEPEYLTPHHIEGYIIDCSDGLGLALECLGDMVDDNNVV